MEMDEKKPATRAFADWVIILPQELEEKLKTEIDEYKESKKMPYISTHQPQKEINRKDAPPC